MKKLLGYFASALVATTLLTVYNGCAASAKDEDTQPAPVFVFHASKYLSIGQVSWIENTRSHECYTVVSWNGTGYAIAPASCPSAER